MYHRSAGHKDRWMTGFHWVRAIGEGPGAQMQQVWRSMHPAGQAVEFAPACNPGSLARSGGAHF